MADKTIGFFVPESFSASYVNNIKDKEGNYFYENQLRDVGMQKQAAIQDLNQTYSDVINNAYSSYLNSKRSVMSSNLGEGYKQAYLQKQEDELQQNIAQANMNAASTRQEIEKQEASASKEVGEAFKTEVSNMNRTAESMQQYLVYLKGLTNKTDSSKKYVGDDQQTYTLDQMYDVVFNAQPQDYIDQNGATGVSYVQWANAQLKDTQADRDWFNWLTTYGGYQQFKQAAQPSIEKETTRSRTETPGTEEWKKSLYDNKTFDEKTGEDFMQKNYQALKETDKSSQATERVSTNLQMWRDYLDLTDDEIKEVLLQLTDDKTKYKNYNLPTVYMHARNAIKAKNNPTVRSALPNSTWDFNLTYKMVEASRKKHAKASKE